MFCKYCGKQIDNDSIFCRYCGKVQDTAKEKHPQKESIGSDHPSNKTELVKSQKQNKDGANRRVLKILMEIGFIALVVLFAFLIKGITFQAINSQQYPEVSNKDQKAFNDAIYKKQHPEETNKHNNPLPSNATSEDWYKQIRQRKFNEYADQPTKYVGLEVAQAESKDFFGAEAAKYLKWGDFKYDKEAHSLSQLYDINEFRKTAIYSHASKTSDGLFWRMLFGILIFRYIMMILWRKKPNPDK